MDSCLGRNNHITEVIGGVCDGWQETSARGPLDFNAESWTLEEVVRQGAYSFS